MFSCKRCGYNTDFKCNLKAHFRRKKPCKPLLSSIPVSTLIEVLNEPFTHKYTQSTHKYTQSTHKLHTNTHNLHTNTHNLHTNTHTDEKMMKKNEFICSFCQKIFSRSDSLKRHQKKYCGSAKISKETKALIENMQKELQKVKLEKEIMSNEMNKLIDKVGDTNIQNQQINIHINNYGTENIEYINKTFVHNLLEMPYKAVPKLLKDIHFNPAHPENHNIKITNKKLPFVGIWRDDKWIIMDKQQALTDLVDKGFNILDDTYLEVESDLHNTKKKAIEEFQEKYNDKDKVLMKNLNKDIELLLINNSGMSKELK